MTARQPAILEDSSLPQRPKVALCWINLGPYHLARARALANLCDLAVIELSGSQRLYGWNVNRSENSFPILTLTAGVWEDQNALLLSWRCWKELSRLRPEILVVPGYSIAPALTMAIWGCVHRVPRVLMSESTAVDRPRSRWKEKAKGLFVTALYSAASFGGKPQLRYLEQLGFSKHKSAPFYNAVDNDFFTSGADAARRFRSPADFSLPKDYFLYVGRLAPEKNLPRLLQAFSTYRRSGGTLELVLAGDGPLKSELSDRAQQLAIKHAVHFAGRLDSASLIPLYAFANSFILPSLSEPWGLVVNEAMAAGLPVMVSSKCGCAEDLVIAGRNGFLFDPSSEEQIAGCLSQMASLPEQTKAAMRRVSLERIKEYSPANWAVALMNLIGNL